MIKVISFDIGGTLLLFDSENSNKYSFDSLALLVNKTKEKVKEAYKEIFQKKTGSLEELVSMFCEMIGITNTSEVEYFLKEKISISDNARLNEDALEVIKELKEKNYKIICLSNSNQFVKSEMPDIMKKYIDKIYYSYNLGYTKSDDEIFRIVEKELEVKPNEILHIGDTFEADYIMPKKNGWNVFYYGKTDDNTVNSSENIKDVLEIL